MKKIIMKYLSIIALTLLLFSCNGKKQKPVESEVFDAEDTVILEYEIYADNAFFEYVFESDWRTVHMKQKFLLCHNNVYICSASTTEDIYSNFQEQLGHIISSFSCA